mmetsp:Transcript_105817/g.326433  ORF Transcript_105817/g.326433 Transcript_105817/m.326433 type:complete len:220 (+) Transcript_105817:494-1153(+)
MVQGKPGARLGRGTRQWQRRGRCSGACCPRCSRRCERSWRQGAPAASVWGPTSRCCRAPSRRCLSPCRRRTPNGSCEARRCCPPRSSSGRGCLRTARRRGKPWRRGLVRTPDLPACGAMGCGFGPAACSSRAAGSACRSPAGSTDLTRRPWPWCRWWTSRTATAGPPPAKCGRALPATSAWWHCRLCPPAGRPRSTTARGATSRRSSRSGTFRTRASWP